MSVVYLESEEVKGELQQLRSILKRCYGPLGNGAMFQPSPGGHVTLTSRSEQLLSMLKPSSPFGRMLLTSLHSHAQLHKDSGLFAGLLAIDLILRGMELKIPRCQVAMVTSYALSLVTDYLCKSAPCKNRLELSSLPEMMSLVRCLLCSKSGICQLSNSELDHLASLLLQCFLIATQKKSDISFAISERVNTHTFLGRPVTQSCLMTGLLVEYDLESSCGSDIEAMLERVREHRGDIVTALFDVSLAGDLPEEFPRDIHLNTVDPSATDGKQELEAVVLGQLMRVASHLVTMGVQFVGCQKVMHPLLKDFLREKGILALDRLSNVNICPLRDITGGRLISSLTTGLSPDFLGKLKAINHTFVHGKRYLVLEGEDGHCSLMLCCKSDYSANELRPLCSSALHVLQQCLHTPYVLQGGGCTETQLGHFLLTKISADHSRNVFKELQCSEKTFDTVMKSVAKSLCAVAVSLEHYGGTVLSDSTSHHCWFFPPEDSVVPVVGGGKRQRDDKTSENHFTAGQGGRVSSDQFIKNRPSYQASIPQRLGKMEITTDEERGEQREETFFGLEKTCGCGHLRLSDLPSTCEWTSLADAQCSTFVPDSIRQCLEGATKESDSVDRSSPAALETKQSLACVCDAFLPKLKAIEMASDLASSLLRVAFSVSEK